MSIEEKIAQIAKEYFSNYAYVFDNLYGIDEALSRVQFPAILSTLPVNGQMQIRRRRAVDSENILIGFFDKVPHDANGEDNAAVYNRMKDEGVRFIQTMNESGLFEYIEEWTYEVWCVRLSEIVTGVFFTVQVKDTKCI